MILYILLAIVIYFILGLMIDMFNVYYCIKFLHKKEELDMVHILLWPFIVIYELIEKSGNVIKRLSNKYTDLMIDAYGDEKLLENKSKDNWVITTTDNWVTMTTEYYEEDNKSVKQVHRIPAKQSRHRYFFVGMKLRMDEPPSLEAVRTKTLNNISTTNMYNLYIRAGSYSDFTTYSEAISVKKVYLLSNSGDDNEKLEFMVEFNKKQNLRNFTAHVNEPIKNIVLFIRDPLTDDLISVINCIFEDFIRNITDDNGVIIIE